MRMNKAERSEAEATLAMTLRGATNGSSKTSTDAAIVGLAEADAYGELAEDIWARIVQAILDAGIHCGGPLTEPDRERLITEICQRIAAAMREPVD
jgi:hypothetical protein